MVCDCLIDELFFAFCFSFFFHRVEALGSYNVAGLPDAFLSQQLPVSMPPQSLPLQAPIAGQPQMPLPPLSLQINPVAPTSPTTATTPLAGTQSFPRQLPPLHLPSLFPKAATPSPKPQAAKSEEQGESPTLDAPEPAKQEELPPAELPKMDVEFPALDASQPATQNTLPSLSPTTPQATQSPVQQQPQLNSPFQPSQNYQGFPMMQPQFPTPFNQPNYNQYLQYQALQQFYQRNTQPQMLQLKHEQGVGRPKGAKRKQTKHAMPKVEDVPPPKINLANIDVYSQDVETETKYFIKWLDWVRTD